MLIPVHFQALDIVFRSRLQAYDAKQAEGPGISRNAKLEALLAGDGRPPAPCEVWAEVATEEEWELVKTKFNALVVEWKACHPKGKLEDNRLQLHQSAKRKVYEELSAKTPGFAEKWETEASKVGSVGPEQR